MNYIEIIILVFQITFVETQIIDLKASYIMELGTALSIFSSQSFFALAICWAGLLLISLIVSPVFSVLRKSISCPPGSARRR